jgi:prolyl-tRNA synthetase
MVVEADSGAIGGKESHEFMVINQAGDDEIIYCPNCGYAANAEKAQGVKPEMEKEDPLTLEEIATPGIKTIEELASLLHLHKNRTLKAVFYSADGELIFVVIRGDLEVNEVKLRNAIKCSELRLANDEEVERAHLVAGSASPLGLSGIKTIADDSIMLGANFVAGANKPGYHIRNVNYPRDFQVDMLLDIATAQRGQGCPRCSHKLLAMRGIEVGHIFKLGTLFSEKLGAFFLEPVGVQKPVVMGCYGIGIARLLAAVIEHSHDEKGIIWPKSLAPYHVYLCALGVSNGEVALAAEKLYAELEAIDIETLFDDRPESVGVKFNDADLLGIPLRLTLSQRTLKLQSVEIKWRTEKESQLVPLREVVNRVREILNPQPT